MSTDTPINIYPVQGSGRKFESLGMRMSRFIFDIYCSKMSILILQLKYTLCTVTVRGTKSYLFYNTTLVKSYFLQ